MPAAAQYLVVGVVNETLRAEEHQLEKRKHTVQSRGCQNRNLLIMMCHVILGVCSVSVEDVSNFHFRNKQDATFGLTSDWIGRL